LNPVIRSYTAPEPYTANTRNRGDAVFSWKLNGRTLNNTGTIRKYIIEIDAGILTNPTIARLALYDMDGSLLEDHLYGFKTLP